MLLQENFAEEHIRELQRTSRRDPVLLERAVYSNLYMQNLKGDYNTAVLCVSPYD